MLYKTVTKIFPTRDLVGYHLKLEDDDRPDLGTDKQVVIDHDFTESYTRGAGVTTSVRNSINNAMQRAVDNYKELKKEFKTTAYKNAETQISDNLKIGE